MTTVQRWTGRETRALRHALRMSIRDFAQHLGVSERTISKWEAGQAETCPRPEMQAALDTALTLAPDEATARFHASGQQPRVPTGGGCGSFHVRSHKFIPAYIGAAAAAELAQGRAFIRRSHPWLTVSTLRLPHQSGECTAHLFACGVIVLHLRQGRDFPDLTSLASWRYNSYAEDLPWAEQRVRTLFDGISIDTPASPEYVLSLYVLPETSWAGDELDTALRLMCVPSVLVNRQDGCSTEPVSGEVERRLLSTGFEPAAIVPFGMDGVSNGYAGWSGLAYHALAPERALGTDELIACELDVQMLWTYCRYIQRQVEDGHDPSMPAEFGWRFLRAAHSRLTTARAQESSQHCVMRQAILTTSGLPERLIQAQVALRETDALLGTLGP
ncbi:helix-turn-helix domain-containing protein [Plantactinospora sp. WMMC1484]|uniref:helix-turn-helix domain-containing protein n=1 Tax=Plantactinospora sp. WMMC1484 TaxID=3404122 RepID=UPI003BF5E716